MKTPLIAFVTSGILIATGALAESEAERNISDAESLYYEAKLVIESDYRKSLAEALAKGERVEVFLLDFEMKETPSDLYLWEAGLDDGEFPIIPYGKKSKILKQATLTAEQKLDFVPRLQEVVGIQEEIDGGSACHYPVYGVRVFAGDTIIFQSSFSLECSNFAISYPGAPAWVAIRGSSLFEALGKIMPIPQAELDRFKAKAEGAKGSAEKE